VESIVKGFGAGWKDAIEKISASVISAFGAGSQYGAVAINARAHQNTVAMVLRRVLFSFIAYFERFDSLVQKHYKLPNIVGAMVPLQTVKFQIRKYDLQGQQQGQAQ
jgi:hypothetical protein